MANDVLDNYLEWEAEFIGLIDGFTFAIPGKDQSLGRDLAGEVALGISDRSVSTQGGADGPWKPNEPKYAARKAKKHGVYNVGILTGQMLSLESVKGETAVSDDEVEMKYGTNEAPTGFSTYGDLRPDEPTDRQKAEWFAEGGREFYQLDETIAAAVHATAGEALAEYLQKG